jgi:hypothetical protein
VWADVANVTVDAVKRPGVFRVRWNELTGGAGGRVMTNPFLVVSTARSFAAMRNGAEALNRAFNSVNTVLRPSRLMALVTQ